MVLKKHKPTTPSCRFTVLSAFDSVTRGHSEKSLTEPKRSKAGRNSAGRITIRHRGGGHKKNYRKIDFKRDKDGIPSKVAEIEYDPNRTARIALLHYADGEKRYVLAPMGLSKGDSVMSGPKAEAKIGNAMPLGLIPLGLPVHNIEMTRGRGGQLIRSAGAAGQIMSREGQYAQIKLPSGEIRLIRVECYATIGQVSNMEHGKTSIGKAGRARWLGRRPTVRGVAMNPVDHPHGGGEGRSSGGGHPVSPWGLQTKGKRTRKKKKSSSKFIVQRR